MFTGIVEEIGEVRRLVSGGPGAVLDVACETVLDGTRVGDSVNVNGCCLTVTALDGSGFRADLMGETLERTGLGALREGSPVNLERALRADARLGGHLVQGHVDAASEVTAVLAEEQWTVLEFRLPDAIAAYVVEKGSIAVDGVSLTVMAVDDGAFSVGLIPHTTSETVLGVRSVGDSVNLEADVIAKYVERMLRGGVATPYSRQEQP